MIQSTVNLFKLIRILKERGNRSLFRRSRQQVWDIIFCRNHINPKNPVAALWYWFRTLKGLDMLIWRLETFGFLFQPGTTVEQQLQLNRYLET